MSLLFQVVETSNEKHAIGLYQQRYAPTILMSGYADNMTYVISAITEHGVPEGVFLIND